MQTSRRPLGQVRRALLVASVFSAGIAVLMLVLPLFALQLLEGAVPAGSVDLIAILAFCAGAVLLVASFLDYCRELVLLRAALWLDHHMGIRILETGIGANLPGRVLKSRADAVATLREALAGGALAPLLDAPWSLLSVAAIALLDPLLGLVCLVIIATMLSLAALLGAATSKRSADSAQHRSLAGNWLNTVAANAPMLSEQIMAAGASRKWELLNRGHVALAYASGLRVGVSRVAARQLRVGGIAAVLAAGAYLAVSGRLAAGAAVAAMLVAARALGTLEQIATGWDRLRDARRAWRLLAASEAEDELRGAASTLATSTGHIVIAGASCGYPGLSVSGLPASVSVLTDIALTIAPGAALGVIGGPGSGKSALAGLIAGVHAPAAGRAEIDGFAIELAQRSTRGAPIGYLSDEPRLVEGSVLENIAGFRGDALEAAQDAAMLAGAHDMIAALPNGYETHVGPDGRAVPLRVRRAVALARALCGNRRLIVLDEPETGLDEAGLQNLERVLGSLRNAGIGLLVATREPRLLRLTDNIAVLGGGTIEALIPSHRLDLALRAPAPSLSERMRQVA